MSSKKRSCLLTTLRGFQTMSISEVYGEFSMTGWFQSSACVNHRLGCGKTQLAHTMAVTAQLPKVDTRSPIITRFWLTSW